jgi:large subunit ribosomal protein L23
MKKPREVIKTLIISEKSLTVRAKNNCYVFEVHRDANKIEIRKAVEALYHVKVDKVTSLVNPGKERRLGRYRPGYRPDWKKALVRLAKNEKITEFENL